MFGMSGLISVTPAELDAMATRYHQESGQVVEQIDRLDKMIDELSIVWKGASSLAFAEQYNLLKPNFQEMSKLLTDVGDQLTRTGNALREADEQIASQIRG